jgi:iron complex outermembrane recepter protein
MRSYVVQQGSLPKVTVSYAIDPSALLYATYSQGSRIGGGNEAVPTTGPASCAVALSALGLQQLPAQYQGDSVTNYETGAKTRWLDGRATVNGSLFYIDWKDVQQETRLACGYPFITNEGSAVSKGAEVEIRALVTNEINVGVTAAYTHAKNEETIPGIVTAGEQLQNVPLWTNTEWLEYSRHMGSDISLFGRASNLYYGDSHDTYDKPAFDIVGLRLGLRAEAYEGAIFVDNLTDRLAILSNTISQGATIPTVRNIAINRPRTIGLDFRYRF